MNVAHLTFVIFQRLATASNVDSLFAIKSGEIRVLDRLCKKFVHLLCRPLLLSCLPTEIQIKYSRWCAKDRSLHQEDSKLL